MLDIIVNNPYRILGVFSNSSKKEIVTNQSKITAFSKVGKQVSFPIDLSSILGAPNRTDEAISKSNSLLALQVDQLKYAQFWFVNVSPLDEIAFNKLTSGDMTEAIEIWNIKDSFSSLQNKAVCAMIQSNYLEAVTLAEQLYTHYTESFLSCLVDNANLFSQETLIKSFIDVLVENQGTPQENNYIDLKSIAASLDNPIWKEYIKSRLLIPLINKVEQAISDAKKECSKKPSQGIEIAQKLKTVVAENLPLIEGFLSKEELQYKSLADKAGTEILNCAIAGYNITANNEKLAKETLSLFKYVQSIVVGIEAQNRCAKNIQIVQKDVDNLPSDVTEVRLIEDAISSFRKRPAEIRYSIELVNTCRPLLLKIARRIGNDSPYYLYLSTKVVDNALHNLIEEVTLVLKQSPKSHYTYDIAIYKMRVKQILSSAWEATLFIESLDMKAGYKIDTWDAHKKQLARLRDEFVFNHKPAEPTTPLSERLIQKIKRLLKEIIHLAPYAIIMLVIWLLSSIKECSSEQPTRRPMSPQYLVPAKKFQTTSSLNTSTSSNLVEANEKNHSTDAKTNSINKELLAGSSILSNYKKSIDSELSKIVIPKENSSAPSYTITKLKTGQYPFGSNKYDQKSLSELMIDNQSEIDAVVVLENSAGKWIRNVFIGRNSSFTMTKIPSGVYIMKTMRGTSWNANKNNGANRPKGGFMKNCCYSKSEWNDPFDFRTEETDDGISYPRYSVTLHTVVNGNFHTTTTTIDDFFE